MSKVQMVRALVNQRLAAAAEEIFGLFERTIAEYEEELRRSKEKNERQQKLLDVVLKPDVRLHSADIQQLVVVKEEVPPEQQEWSPSLDQEDPPEPPHIKEEQEELWTSQEGEQLQGLEEADITKFLFTPVPVKSEDDEEKPQSSQLHQRQTEQMETGADGEDCGGPEPARNSHPDLHLQPETEYSEEWNYTTEHESSVNLSKKSFSYSKCGFTKAESQKCFGPQSSQLHQQDETEDSSDTEDSDDWSKDSREPPSGSKSLKNNEVSKSGVRCNTEENPLSCSLCGKAYKEKINLRQHMAVHTGEKRFSCSVCEKGFKRKRDMKEHMAVHTGEKRFSCSVCDQRFTWRQQLAKHKLVCHQSSQLHKTEQNREAEPGASSSTEQMETGADGEDCGGPEPARNSHPDTHLQPVTEDSEDWNDTTEHESSINLSKKPFSCSKCGSTQAQNHKCVSPQSSQLHQQDKTEDPSDTEHSNDWSKEIREPPSGSKSLKNNEVSKSGVRCNTEENPLSFSLCGKAFRGKKTLKRHVAVHTGEKRFSCSVCEKGFKRKQTLTLHMAIHTGQKPFKCSVCEKAFTRKGSLTLHMAIHRGEKRFCCSVCDQRFTWPYQLAKHRCVSPQSSQLHQQDKTEDSSDIEHNDDWSEDNREPPSDSKSLNNNEVSKSGVRCNTKGNPLSCSICGKAFRHKGNLRQHMAVHTGEKRFSCSVCEKRFKQKGDMKEHMAVHTGEKRFSCSVCDQRFTWRQQLAKHKRVCPQSSQLHKTEQNREAEPGASSSTEQMETGADGEDCGGPELARTSHPDPELGP